MTIISYINPTGKKVFSIKQLFSFSRGINFLDALPIGKKNCFLQKEANVHCQKIKTKVK